ncbi:hypothetical protein AK812_SmicGene7175 [Symbiodinium microadriaticum]|uniref:Uncharacterized protein n=1 Tax=Symbiodinium microadriaticum TaxID=2951 RepID=A0A1Q9EPE2_SYMMI|nr:hypothetical protein AK812_SmicGene7175 [Symbiodinium microadriaticum]
MASAESATSPTEDFTKATSAEVQEAVTAFMEIADISITGSESVGRRKGEEEWEWLLQKANINHGSLRWAGPSALSEAGAIFASIDLSESHVAVGYVLALERELVRLRAENLPLREPFGCFIDFALPAVQKLI